MSSVENSSGIRIGDRSIDELEAAMTDALIPVLGGGVHIRITKIIRCDDEVSGLELEAAIAIEEEVTAFAIG